MVYSLRGTWHLLVKEPRIGVLCGALFVLILGLGIWAVWEGGQATRAQARDAVHFSLDQVLEGLKEDINTAAFPNIAMQLYVLEKPKLTDLFDPAGASTVGGVNPNFDDLLAPNIYAAVPYAAALRGVLLAPACVVNSASPMAARQGDIMGNEGAMGLNLLCDERCNATGTTYSGCVSAAALPPPPPLLLRHRPLFNCSAFACKQSRPLRRQEPQACALTASPLLCAPPPRGRYKKLATFGGPFPYRRAETLLTIARAPQQTLAGPYVLSQGGVGAIARLPCVPPRQPPPRPLLAR